MGCRRRLRGGRANSSHPFAGLEKELLLFLFGELGAGNRAGEQEGEEENSA